MRKFLLTSSLVLAFALYVWHANAPAWPGGDDAPVVVPDRRSTPLPQAAAPAPAQEAAPQPASSVAAAPPASAAPAAPPKPAAPPAPRGMYRDGSYRGDAADAYYGYVQVEAVIRGGKLADVQVLQHPNDRSRSIYINSIAMPDLVSEAVQAQNAQVDIVSGATDSSLAFRDSLASALALARN